MSIENPPDVDRPELLQKAEVAVNAFFETVGKFSKASPSTWQEGRKIEEQLMAEFDSKLQSAAQACREAKEGGCNVSHLDTRMTIYFASNPMNRF